MGADKFRAALAPFLYGVGWYHKLSNFIGGDQKEQRFCCVYRSSNFRFFKTYLSYVLFLLALKFLIAARTAIGSHCGIQSS